MAVALIVVILAAVAGLIIVTLSPEEKSLLLRLIKENGVYLLSAATLLLAGIGFALDGIFRVYILPVGKLSEETALIFGANSAHRLPLEGSKDRTGPFSTVGGAMLMNMLRCEVAQRLVDRGIEPVFLPSHQFVGSRTVEEQLEYFYAQFARRVGPLYARQGG